MKKLLDETINMSRTEKVICHTKEFIRLAKNMLEADKISQEEYNEVTFNKKVFLKKMGIEFNV